MTSIAELHKEAFKLRKEKKYTEAERVFQQIWRLTGDQFDGTGLLSCLRKQQKYEQAIPIADELIEKFPEFEWARDEAIWTYIEGVIQKINENESLAELINAATKVMNLKPKVLPAKLIVFKVLKCAKAVGNWGVVHEWSGKLNADELSTTPMTDEKGREGWCDQSLWFNYRIKSCIENGKELEALGIIEKILDRFPKQKKFFSRLQALANYRLGRLYEAEKIYKELCSHHRPDWWMLHEYARTLREMGLVDEALKAFYQAAASHNRLEAMVTLFKDIGLHCKEMGLHDIARAHLILSSLIRAEQGWTIPDDLSSIITELNKTSGREIPTPSSINEALAACRKDWRRLLNGTNKKPKRGLAGIVLLGESNRPFCFIKGDDNESYFSYKSDLPKGIIDGSKVSFNAVPSFDKKKKKESWRAVDINRAG